MVVGRTVHTFQVNISVSEMFQRTVQMKPVGMLLTELLDRPFWLHGRFNSISRYKFNAGAER